MKRLTKPDGEYTSAIRLKLKAYEDTGIEPSEIFTSTELANIACALRELRQYRELGTIDRLRELIQADREGRCVVLPKEGILKKGDKVWYCDKETAEIESGTVVSAFYKNGKLKSFSVDSDSGDFDEFVGSAFGTCFFKSYEAAEAAIVGT